MPEIDGLELLSLSVIINHIDKNLLPSGYLGVDIFFVISFCHNFFTSIENCDNFCEFILGFYSRRIKRYTTLAYVIALSITTALFNPLPFEILSYAERALLGLSNITFLEQLQIIFLIQLL